MTGGARPDGPGRVVGAKNSVLKLMAAALLAPGPTTIGNLPAILDVTIMRELLGGWGARSPSQPATVAATRSSSTSRRRRTEAPYELVRKIRGSISVLGPLVARTGGAGGAARRRRDRLAGLDMHIAGLERMGARSARARLHRRRGRGLRGAPIWLDFPSVGATENILTAAVLAKGTTVIDNAAREPEIVDLCTMLVSMGAQIDGIGTSTLEITGVDGCPADARRRSRPDRRGHLGDRCGGHPWGHHVRGALAAHLRIALDKLARAGGDVEVVEDGFRVRRSTGPAASTS